MKVLSAAAAATLLTLAPALAGPATLSGDELRRMVAGRTIVLDTPVGGLPIVYRPDGSLSGKLNVMAAGVMSGPREDKGRWWIAANEICQQWNAWLDGRRHCYSMRVEGKVVHWRRGDGRTGTARLLAH